MPFRFYCTNCQQRLSVSSRKRGQEVKCPRCRRVILVPAGEPDNAGDKASDAEVKSFPQVSPQDELLYAEPAPIDDEGGTGTQQSVTVPRYVLYTQGFLLGAVALVFFVFGLIVGSRSSNEGVSKTFQPATVSGTIFFEDNRESATPDAGSVVVLLPASKRPDEKVTAVGLRPDDPEPDEDHPALATLRSLGGDYTRTDRHGRYHVRAASAGRYYLLVISKKGRRTEDEHPDASELAQLGRYFLPATELLGQQRFEWKELLLRSDQQVDVTF